MDRKALAVCVGIALPLWLVSLAGCQRSPEDLPVAAQSDAAFDSFDLQAMAPGPWRRSEALPVLRTASRSGALEPLPSDAPAESPAAIEQEVFNSLAPNEQVETSAVELTTPEGVAGDEDGAAQNTPPDAPAPRTSPLRPELLEAVEPGQRTERSVPAQDAASEQVSLPWAKAVPRTPELISVAERADDRVRHGFQLATRGATYSARAEFTATLQMFAQAYDIQQHTTMHAKSLAAGLTALKEAGDFLRSSPSRGEAEVARIVAGHKTPLLKEPEVEPMSPLAAAQRYYTFAQEQLAVAAAQEPAGSMALVGLGKLAFTAHGQPQSRNMEQTAQAMTLYQAALMCSGANFIAANELGVLMAETGRLEQARNVLLRSANLSPQVATYRNLAVVHTRLGEASLAESAKRQATALAERVGGSSSPAVRWVDPETFARTLPAADAVVANKSSAAPSAAALTPQQRPGNTASRGSAGWLPFSTRR